MVPTLGCNCQDLQLNGFGRIIFTWSTWHLRQTPAQVQLGIFRHTCVGCRILLVRLPHMRHCWNSRHVQPGALGKHEVKKIGYIWPTLILPRPVGGKGSATGPYILSLHTFNLVVESPDLKQLSGNRAPAFSLKSLKASATSNGYPTLSQKHLSRAALSLEMRAYKSIIHNVLSCIAAGPGICRDGEVASIYHN